MRCVLACSKCRKQKIRCIHNGTGPCTYCIHKGCADECVLTYPPRKVNRDAKKKKVSKPESSKKGRSNSRPSAAVLQDETGLPQLRTPQYNTNMSQQPISVPQMVPAPLANNIHMGQQLPNSQQIHVKPPRTYQSFLQPRPSPPSNQRFGTENVVQPVSTMGTMFSPGILPQMSNEPAPFSTVKNGPADPIFSSIDKLVAFTPTEHIFAAVKRAGVSFPECPFFHFPTFDRNLKDVNPILLGAILSLCSLFTPFKDTDNSSKFSSNDKWLGINSFQVENSLYEKLSLDAIFHNGLFLLKPDIEICQALILLSCVKWGQNDYYAAWMLHGCGTRLIQALQFDERFQQQCKQQPLLKEARNRTFWSAFCLDRIISTGDNRCFAISKFEDVELPLPDTYYYGGYLNSNNKNSPNGDMYETPETNSSSERNSSGSVKDSTIMPSEFELQLQKKVTMKSFNTFYKANPHLLYQNEFSAYLKSYSLWGTINDYMMEGGRAKRPNEVPWDSENSLVGRVLKEVEEFWDVLPAEWKWPTFDYVSQRQYQVKKVFVLATINCLHCLVTIFCIREYLPFLPSKELGPCGPIDPPLLPNPTIPEYWVNMHRKCFSALRQLCEILEAVYNFESTIPKDSSNGALNLIEASPFFCFCAFVCAIQCNYGINFPYMDPDYDTFKNSKGKNLGHCYKVMLRILKLREQTCQITKNWLHMVFKVKEMYRSVSNPRNGDKLQTSGPKSVAQVLGTAPTMAPASMKDQIGQTQVKPELSQSSIKTRDASTMNPPSIIMASNHNQPYNIDSVTNNSSRRNSAQRLLSPPNSFLQPPDQLPILQTDFLTSNDKFSKSRNNSQMMFPVNGIKLENNLNSITEMENNALFQSIGSRKDSHSVSSSNSTGTPSFPIEVQPDTDKFSLLFSDQEFEMLMQFSQ